MYVWYINLKTDIVLFFFINKRVSLNLYFVSLFFFLTLETPHRPSSPPKAPTHFYFIFLLVEATPLKLTFRSFGAHRLRRALHSKFGFVYGSLLVGSC